MNISEREIRNVATHWRLYVVHVSHTSKPSKRQVNCVVVSSIVVLLRQLSSLSLQSGYGDERPLTSYGGGGMPASWMVLQGITWYYMVLQGITWYYMVLQGTTWYSMVLHGITWYCKVLHGIARYCMVLRGIAIPDMLRREAKSPGTKTRIVSGQRSGICLKSRTGIRLKFITIGFNNSMSLTGAKKFYNYMGFASQVVH